MESVPSSWAPSRSSGQPTPRVVVSGCHSGPNPSPGLGIAQSLRLAFPSARLVARDFSPAATGLHAEVFDEAWLCPPWDDADLDLAWQHLERRLEGAWLISGLDLEARWLAGFDHPRILAPPADALNRTSKPAIAAAAGLPVRVPPWVPFSAGEREVERFCRRHGWRVWAKGPAYESRGVSDWRGLREAAVELEETWGGTEPFVQAHVEGEEVSVAFAALRGELLDAVFLEKRGTTPEGKAWGGCLASVPEPLAEALRAVLRDLRWSGGGELEFIRGASGGLWLIDWNPRFPAWIHGATLAGHNLPAALVGRATGLSARPTERRSDGFVRVVVEIPAREALPPGAARPRFGRALGKHPSGMPQLSRRLSAVREAEPEAGAAPLDGELARDLLEAAAGIRSTPQRVVLARTATARFAAVARLGERHPGLEVAYSLKTNPDPRLLTLARESGLWAEAISGGELAWALDCGWTHGQVVYNGPVPLTAPAGIEPLRAAFADDSETLARYLRKPPARIVGARMRPPLAESRFGVPLVDPVAFEALASLLAGASPDQLLGVSFHVPSSEVGMERWEQMATAVIDFAATIERLSGRSLSLIDLGGGWTPDDFDTALEPALERLLAGARSRLAGEPTLLIEPGKALVEPALVVLARVVHVRAEQDGRRAAVLDAGIAEVPLVHSFPHRLALVRDAVETLDAGEEALVGPTCMEADVLAEGVRLPADLAPGDLVAIFDAGAYDASTAHVFGRGGRLQQW